MNTISRRGMLAAAFAGEGGVRRAMAQFEGKVEASRHPGFSTVQLTPGGEAALRWTRETLRGAATMRIAVGNDDREARPVRVKLGKSGRELGAFDIRFACDFEPFDLELDAQSVREAQQEGVRLVQDGGTKPLWLLAPTTSRAEGLGPQLMQAGARKPEGEFIERMNSLDALQEVTWMEGCVLEGQRDLGLADGWKEHLEFWFNEPARSEKMFGVENTLPVASLARWKPEHPAVARVIAYWRKMTREDQTIGHGISTVAEANYTVSYPMAVLSKLVEDEWLERQALRQLRAARERLVFEDKQWLRAYADGRRTFPNWCRGVCWYSLGLVRTLIELKDRPGLEDLKTELARVLKFAKRYQREDGLYSCFLDVPAIAPDCAGSAGIGAAMALAAKHGLAGAESREAARATWNGLVRKLTRDGFLTGVSQSNKAEAGEGLQRGDYRVTLQFGMGLMAQLKAALDGPVKRA